MLITYKNLLKEKKKQLIHKLTTIITMIIYINNK